MDSISRSSTRISRVMIFIDGNYLESRLKKSRFSEINYSGFAGYLTRNSNFGNPTLVRCYFYDGLPYPEQKLSFLGESEQIQRKNELQNQYQKKKDALEKIAMLDYFEVRKGKAVYEKKLNKENWGFRQKGVDSLIAIDMLTKAYQGQYDVGVLVAGDSDFIEIVKSVKNSGVNIMGAYFKEEMPKELEQEFDRKFLFDWELLNTHGAIKQL